MLPGDQLLILVFVLVSLFIFTGAIGSYGDNVLVWAPSLLFTVPIAIINAIAGAGFWFLAPLLLIVFLAYIGGLESVFGEAILYLALFGVVVMTLGV